MNNATRRRLTSVFVREGKREHNEFTLGLKTGALKVGVGPFPQRRQRPKDYKPRPSVPRGLVVYNDNRGHAYV